MASFLDALDAGPSPEVRRASCWTCSCEFITVGSLVPAGDGQRPASAESWPCGSNDDLCHCENQGGES